MLGQIFYSAGNALSSGGSEPPTRSERVITDEIKEGGSAALFRNGASAQRLDRPPTITGNKFSKLRSRFRENPQPGENQEAAWRALAAEQDWPDGETTSPQ
jgi:hypothetical protein